MAMENIKSAYVKKPRHNFSWYFFRIAFVVLVVTVGVLLMDGNENEPPEPIYSCPPAMAEANAIDELTLTKTAEDIYSLNVASKGTEGTAPSQSSGSEITLCKELKFRFESVINGSELNCRLDNINFRDFLHHEMYAIGFYGNNFANGTKGFFSIKDTPYPPPSPNSSVIRTPGNSQHSDFSKNFSVQSLSLQRDPMTRLFKVSVSLRYTPNASGIASYEAIGTEILFDSIRNNYTIVLSVKPGTRGLDFGPRAVRLFDHANKYSGRPSGWPGVDPRLNPGCPDLDGNWNHTEGIAVVVIDKTLHTDRVDWNLITQKKALLCFK
jgi:hypothetical protein